MFVGVDGCQTGWLSVEISSGELRQMIIFPSIHDLWKIFSKSILILIDMPIGLVDKGTETRKTDKEARRLLTRKRSSSVFPIACRPAVYASNYEEANQINREKTGKGVSKQSWNITPKIRELDDFLRNNKDATEIMVESHPELCFAFLGGGKPMEYYKRTEKGYQERIEILRKYQKNIKSFLEKQLDRLDINQADRDDIMDASALAITASFGRSKLKFVPENYEHDSKGLPMRMAYPNSLEE